ncbi:MAG: hypothetical protein BHW26_03620 [Faecalibacterium prausnitzii]|nr:MAG: hypothetical protein BHW26_03620 [Faecalibacterium prausnitzii]
MKPAKPEKSIPAVPVIAKKPDAEEEPDAAPEKPAVPMPAMVFAEDKASKPHAAPAMQFFGKGDDEKAPAAPARATPPDNDDSMSLPLMFLNDGDEVAPVEPPKEEAPAQPAEEAGRLGKGCLIIPLLVSQIAFLFFLRGPVVSFLEENARDAGTGGGTAAPDGRGPYIALCAGRHPCTGAAPLRPRRRGPCRPAGRP